MSSSTGTTTRGSHDHDARGLLVVIQASPYCNLACDYCYLQNKDDRSRVPREVLSEIFRQTLDFVGPSRKVTYLWHAGEPLTLGIDFYEQAWELASSLSAERGARFGFAIQTNGVLLNESWIEFIRSRDVTVGLSIDGPEDVHDAYRRFRNGAGSHRHAMRAAQRLWAANIPFGVIAVLTQNSLSQPDRLFEFFHNHPFTSVGFNLEETEGANQGLTASEEILSAYRQFMTRWLSLRSTVQAPVRVRELEQMIGNVLYASTERPPRSTTTIPFEILTFTTEGDFATYCPELCGSASDRFPRFEMGNVRHSSLADLTDSPIFQEVSVEIERGRERCADSCSYWSVCGGGLPSNKFWETGRFDSTETAHCRLHVQTLADVVIDHLEASLELSSVESP